MINKALRIMIADPQHVQRLRLERDLNRQGYYAIAPVSSLEDLLKLVEYGDRGFDLVLINASLAGNEGFNLHDFSLGHPLIGQAFIYDQPQRRFATLIAKTKGSVEFSRVQLPDGPLIRRLLHATSPSMLSVMS